MAVRQETLIETANARVRIMVLAPGEKVPWHFHKQVTDNIFGLEGTLEISLKSPDETLVLAPGERCRILPLRIHRVMNRGTDDARYLLVQGGGEYDFSDAAE